MPNWCNNNATIEFSSKETADEFLKHLELMDNPEAKDVNGNELTLFGYFVPEPKYDQEGDAMPGWYWWRVNNWGTKWDASTYHIQRESDTSVFLGFDSAWSPPIELYDAMEEQGISVSASYYEPGMCFVGNYGGEHLDYGHLETADEIRDFLGADLDDEWNISEYIREIELEEAEEEISENDSGVESYG